MSEVSFQPAPIATWNPAIGVWEKKDQVNLLCAHSELFSEVWPTSGQMVTMPDGSVCALPMPVRLTADSESSSSELGENLPTPRASEPGSTSPGYGDSLNDIASRMVNGFAPKDTVLLRSPKASEASGGALGEAEALKRGNTVGVRDQVMDLVAGQGLKVSRQANNELLGTPRATASESSSVQVAAGAPKGRIEDQVKLTDWGKFEPAIRRWEAVMGRPAPAPTLPDGKDGNHRLSPWLTEWMMGLPEGWICSPEIGLTRNEQLKAAGNGVCPQQAMLALDLLGITQWITVDN